MAETGSEAEEVGVSQRDLVHGVAQQHDDVVVEGETSVVSDAGSPPHQQGVAQPDDQPVNIVSRRVLWNYLWNVSQTVGYIYFIFNLKYWL